MRHLRRTRWVQLLGLLFGTNVASAQLRVLRVTPTDSGTPGTVLTITFNRPVAGVLGRTMDASRAMTLTPATPGITQWRDPATLRFIPTDLFTPGTHIEVAVDTAFVASAGARTGAPYRFSVRIPGPAPVAPPSPGMLAPKPTVGVTYSAPVDLDAVSRVSRFELSAACGGRTIPAVAVRQRPVPNENGDDGAGRFWRIVDLTARDSLPAGCTGMLRVASLDPARPNDTWASEFSTYPPFTVDALPCRPGTTNPLRVCDPDGLRVRFSSSVSADQLRRYVRVSPALRTTWPARGFAGAVDFVQRLTPGTVYTVTVDTAIRDFLGRRLEGPHVVTVRAFDRAPAIEAQSGLTTISPAARSVAIRVVNVERLRMTVTPIPDSLMTMAFASTDRQRNPLVSDLRRTLGDSLSIDIPVRARLNDEITLVVPLPASVGLAGAARFHVVRFEIAKPMAIRDSVHAVGQQPVDRGLIVQVSNLVAHAKLGDGRGAIFVTHRDGSPVAGASVTLRDVGWGSVANADSIRNSLKRPIPPFSSGRTNADGLALLTRIDGVPMAKEGRYLEVREGFDRLILPVGQPTPSTLPTPLDQGALGTAAGNAWSLHGAVVVARDMYRPGEMVHLKAYVRHGTLGALAIAPADSVRLTLSDFSTPIATRLRVTDAFGTVADSIPLPDSVRPGRYWASGQVKTIDGWIPLTSTEVRIAEFRAPEFLVSLKADTTPRFSGDTLTAAVSASYLFDAPMAGATVRWAATPVGNADVPGTTGYGIGIYDSWQAWAERPPAIQGADSLDAHGTLALRVPTHVGQFTRPTMLELSVVLADVNNQTVSATARVPIHSSSFYIGARMRAPGAPATQRTQTVDIIAVRPTGARIAKVPIRATIVRWRQSADGDPATWWRSPSRLVADTVQRSMVNSELHDVSVGFIPLPDAEFYEVRLEALDEHHRAVLTSIEWSATARGWTPVPAPSIKLRVTANPARDPLAGFALGDTAAVRFDCPFSSANAWITYEREGVLEQRRLTVGHGTTVVRVPITERFAPSVWVGVTLTRRSSTAHVAADSMKDALIAGYVELRVDSTVNMLRVEVTPPAAPALVGDTVSIGVHVRDVSPHGGGRGVTSQVALWAVDEGIISLTGFRTPDLLRLVAGRTGVGASLRTSDAFLPWRAPRGVRSPTNVARWSYDSTSRAFPFVGFPGDSAIVQIGAVMSIAGPTSLVPPHTDGAVAAQGDPSRIRADFRWTAFYIGSAITNANGEAELRAGLPDNITTFRIIATAVSGADRFGSGDARLVVTRPIVVRPALPRFVRPGDSVALGAIVNVHQRASAVVQLRASVNGGALMDDSARTVTVTETRGQVARFAVVLADSLRAGMDVTRVTFAAAERSTGAADAIAMTIPTRPQSFPRAHTFIGAVRDTGTLSLSLPADIDPARSSMTFSLGASPIVAMRADYRQLCAYAFSSTDVLITRARAELALARAEHLLGTPDLAPRGLDSGTVRADMQTAVDEIVRRAAGHQEVSYWPESFVSVGPWLSVYVGTFLREARAAGAVVPDGLESGIRGQLNIARVITPGMMKFDSLTGSPQQRQARVQGYLGLMVVIARYLRQSQAPVDSVEDGLFARSGEMAWEDRLGLVELMADRPGDSVRARELLRQLWSAATVAGRRVEIADSLRAPLLFPSHIRPAARLLSITLRLDPQHPLLGALAETVIQQGAAEGGYAWNTEDYGAAILALAEMVRREQSGSGGQLVVRGRDGRILFSRPTVTARTQRDDSLSSLAGLISLDSGGTATLRASIHVDGATRELPLYYAFTVYETPHARPTTPDIAGIFVERWYERLDDGTPVVEVHEGDMVRVQIRVTVPGDRQFVALEDPLPAGLEPVDLSLRTSATLSPFMGPEGPRSPPFEVAPTLWWQSIFYGGWDNGWWSPWESKVLHDDRVVYFTRQLWAGSYTTSYIARATTPGVFVRPPAHAEEIYNPAVQGRSDGGVFTVKGPR